MGAQESKRLEKNEPRRIKISTRNDMFNPGMMVSSFCEDHQGNIFIVHGNHSFIHKYSLGLQDLQSEKVAIGVEGTAARLSGRSSIVCSRKKPGVVWISYVSLYGIMECKIAHSVILPHLIVGTGIPQTAPPRISTQNVFSEPEVGEFGTNIQLQPLSIQLNQDETKLLITAVSLRCFELDLQTLKVERVWNFHRGIMPNLHINSMQYNIQHNKQMWLGFPAGIGCLTTHHDGTYDYEMICGNDLRNRNQKFKDGPRLEATFGRIESFFVVHDDTDTIIYIADRGPKCIRKCSSKTGLVSSIYIIEDDPISRGSKLLPSELMMAGTDLYCLMGGYALVIVRNFAEKESFPDNFRIGFNNPVKKIPADEQPSSSNNNS